MEKDGNQKLYEHSEKLKGSMNKNRIPFSEHKDKDAHTLEIKYLKLTFLIIHKVNVLKKNRY